MNLRILIIEDEKFTARDLAATLREIDEAFEILPFLQSADEALYFLNQHPKVDLIFSDIDLGDGLSFDVFKQVSLTTPVIFCTAYQEYTLQAFKTFGIEYILKPFSRADIEQALNKFLLLQQNFSQTASAIGQSVNLLLGEIAEKAPKAILVQKGDKIFPVDYNDIAFFAIENELTVFYTFAGQRYFVSDTLEQLEQRLSPHFFRANRQVLICRKAVLNVVKHFNQKLLINPSIHYQEQIMVGKLKATAFLNWLGGVDRKA
jgi:DNA-binding LytR/AlgR family response regulator